MISDNYLIETSEMLHSLGFEAGFMGDLREGDEFAILEKDYSGEETQDKIEFLSVVSMRESLNHVVIFIARNVNGITRPCSYGASWGIYIKRR